MNGTDARISFPLTPKGVAAFLSGSRVEGFGPAYARRLVELFGTDALRVLADEPELAMEVPGLGETRVMRASESLRNNEYPIDVQAFLFDCGLSETYIDRIFGKYHRQTPEVIARDPYSMIENVWQFGFFTADKVGRALGIASDDPRRLQGALVSAVKHYAELGHLYCRPQQAVDYASSITGVSPELIEREITGTVADGRLVSSRGDLYLPVFYNAEEQGAKRLAALASALPEMIAAEELPARSRAGHMYSPAQREAMRMALNSSVMVLTGGPGSGKTTVLRGVIEMLQGQGKSVVLAAPTGRAAKRMTMLTGVEAYTIHRLLGYRRGEGYHTKKIDADVLIIDEGSMMEQVLFNHLLQALHPGTKLIIVGDADQLPAIGAGDVLHDLIASGVVPVVHLSENFRQEQGSLIAAGARAINAGEMPDSDPARDFMILPESTTRRIHDRIIALMGDELPRTRGISPADIQVVTPQQIGPLGARQLNADLQQALNPEGPALCRGGTMFRLGDPVMQTANSRERGIYNGETGRITSVSPETQTLEVTYADGRRSNYARSELSELVLAYATTVHKLQGSEVQNMILPVTMAHKPMLYRNLLYTGVSRAVRLCVLVGEEEALRYAISNTPASTRNSRFARRLAEHVQKS